MRVDVRYDADGRTVVVLRLYKDEADWFREQPPGPDPNDKGIGDEWVGLTVLGQIGTELRRGR